jgi:sirohydrochlorin ferrochelatase
MLTARTLAEAHLYASVMAAADPTLPDAATEPVAAGAELVEGAEAWTLTSGEVEVEIPYVSEQAARQVGARFGLGVSQLVDAGQWVLVATTYARRALEADLAYADGPAEERRRIELNWELAADAMTEATKFLPAGADAVPDEAIWSELGTQARTGNPELFTRARLLDDLAYYRDTLSDFRALHGPSN